MWYFVVFQPSECKKTHFQRRIWSIWPIFPNDSESLPKVCYIKQKNSEILSKCINSESAGGSAAWVGDRYIGEVISPFRTLPWQKMTAQFQFFQSLPHKKANFVKKSRPNMGYPKFCIGFKIRKSRSEQLLLSGSGHSKWFSSAALQGVMWDWVEQ